MRLQEFDVGHGGWRSLSGMDGGQRKKVADIMRSWKLIDNYYEIL